MTRAALLTACLVLTAWALPAQPAPAPLRIGGDLPALTLTLTDLAAMPHTAVEIRDHDKSFAYEGVLLYSVLKRAGAPFGDLLRGKALASYVLATARDGYQVTYTLTEIDPDFTSNRIIIADRLDGKPLPNRTGPLRIIVPGERKLARSVRMLDRIDVVMLRK